MRVGGCVAVVVTGLALACAGPAAAQYAVWSYPQGIAVAPDGKHVYVGSRGGTLALARDASTGQLTQVGIFGPTGGPVELSPDGTSLYTGRSEQLTYGPVLLAFRRDANSGELTPVEVSGWQGTHTPGDIAVSPDGANVYATDPVKDELAVFARSQSDGSLTYIGSAPNAPGEIDPRGMAISPDGRWLYAGGRLQDAGGRVVRYERLPGGLLSIAQVTDCGSCVGDSLALSPTGWLYVGAPGLTAVRWDAESGELGELGAGPWISAGGDEPGGAGVAVAGDGSMYAADTWEHKLLQHRPVADGFELVRAYREFDAGAEGLRYLRSIALSPDGRHLYVAAGPHFGDRAGTVATFARDPGSGDLTFVSLVTGRLEGEPFSVTINGGAEYTDDPRVQVTVSQTDPFPGSLPFPKLEFANDGGFVGGRVLTTRPEGTYAWTLASTGPERLPKTVYARPAFDTWRGETASDTIVLDETRPVVVAARRVRVRALRVHARDRLSGVRRVQFAARRGGHARWLRYRAKKRYAVRRGQVWVRVRDRAGNRSRWRLVRAAGARR